MYSEIHLLLQMHRHKEAAERLQRILSGNPEQPYALCLLAICLAELDDINGALEAAHRAVHLDPEGDMSYYALARAQLAARDLDAAMQAIQMAIKIDPLDADFHSIKSGIHIMRQQWQHALDAAEVGLSLDSEHSACHNHRMLTLQSLRQRDKIDDAIDTVLKHDPNDSYTHANVGWTQLEKGNRKKAVEHFEESLRLNPNNEYARHGVITALKSGNPLYRLLLKWAFWLGSMPQRTRTTIILVLFMVYMLSSNISESFPGLSSAVRIFQNLYIAFALSTWLADPLLNLALYLNPLGRKALSSLERRCSMVFGLVMLVAFPCWVTYLVQDNLFFLMLALIGLSIMIFSAGVLSDRSPDRVRFNTLFAMIGSSVSLITGVLLLTGNIWSETAMTYTVIMTIAYQLYIVFGQRQITHAQTGMHRLQRSAFLAAAVLVGLLIALHTKRPLSPIPLSVALSIQPDTEERFTTPDDFLAKLAPTHEAVSPDNNMAFAWAKMIGPDCWMPTGRSVLRRRTQWADILEASTNTPPLSRLTPYATKKEILMYIPHLRARYKKVDSIPGNWQLYSEPAFSDWVTANPTVLNELNQSLQLPDFDMPIRVDAAAYEEGILAPDYKAMTEVALLVLVKCVHQTDAISALAKDIQSIELCSRKLRQSKVPSAVTTGWEMHMIAQLALMHVLSSIGSQSDILSDPADDFLLPLSDNPLEKFARQVFLQEAIFASNQTDVRSVPYHPLYQQELIELYKTFPPDPNKVIMHLYGFLEGYEELLHDRPADYQDRLTELVRSSRETFRPLGFFMPAAERRVSLTSLQGNMLIVNIISLTEQVQHLWQVSEVCGLINALGFASRHYQKKHGQLPSSQEDLIPTYFKSPVKDPYGEGPLIFKKQNNELTIYSVGPDREDDYGNVLSDIPLVLPADPTSR
jgi:tetratricopeptide (TPR) repeat protein